MLFPECSVVVATGATSNTVCWTKCVRIDNRTQLSVCHLAAGLAVEAQQPGEDDRQAAGGTALPAATTGRIRWNDVSNDAHSVVCLGRYCV
jgi:hypothetical protein